MKKIQNIDKNSIKIDDDGNLHLYLVVALNGKRWALQTVFPEEQIKMKNFEHLGIGLVKTAIRSLQSENIIYE